MRVNLCANQNIYKCGFSCSFLKNCWLICRFLKLINVFFSQKTHLKEIRPAIHHQKYKSVCIILSILIKSVHKIPVFFLLLYLNYHLLCFLESKDSNLFALSRTYCMESNKPFIMAPNISVLNLIVLYSRELARTSISFKQVYKNANAAQICITRTDLFDVQGNFSPQHDTEEGLTFVSGKMMLCLWICIHYNIFILSKCFTQAICMWNNLIKLPSSWNLALNHRANTIPNYIWTSLHTLPFI